MLKKFIDFLKVYNVVGLAIAVIIGGKLNVLVTSVVNDLVMPLLLQPLLDRAGVSHVRELNFNGIFYGRVLGSGLDFIIIAFVVFLFAKIILKEETVSKK